MQAKASKKTKAKIPPTKGERPFWLVLDVHGVLIQSSERWIMTLLSKRTHQPKWLMYLRWMANIRLAQKGKMQAKAFYEKVLDQKLTQKEFNEWVMKGYAMRGDIPFLIMKELIRLKKEGWKLAILSDMNTAQAEFHRNKTHFSIFDEVFISCETGLMKPYPGAFSAFEKRLKTRKDHIVFCDDLWFNSFGAMLHGWRAVTIKGHKQLEHFLKDLH